MEGEKHWRLLNDTSIPVYGSSCSTLNNSVYLTGGMSADNKKAPTVLQVRQFDLEEMNWVPTTINANNALNRAYHASCSLGGSLFLIGGAVATMTGGKETLLPEVLICTPDSLEGLKCVITPSPIAELKGHSACTMGAGDLLQKVVIFGGSSAEGTCDSNDIIVYVGDNEEEMSDIDVLKKISVNGPAPEPRSHHACAVAGRRQEYLVISAGWNGSEAFDDLWICDMTNVLSGRPLDPPPPPSPPKGKKKDETPIPELYTWHQILMSEPIERRFMHGCWATCSETLINGIKIGIFGGMTAYGPVAHEAMYQYAVEFDGEECVAQLEYAQETERENESNEELRFGFSSVIINESGSPSVIFIFGGKRGNCDSQCCILNTSSDMAAHLDNHVPLPRENEDEEESNIKVIKYSNGDTYEGEIFVDVDEEGQIETKEDTDQIRHGQGVMKYADGAIYEGQWQYNNQHGHGKYVTCDQATIYDGSFHENEFNGEGQLSLQNGDVIYNGNFEFGKYKGSGMLLDNTAKTLYEGEFSDGMKNGKGVLRQVNENNDSDEPGQLIYEGSWKDDKPTGTGTLVLSGGHVYTGDIVDSKPEGKGVCKYADGGEYTGSWRAGRRNGTGEYVSRNLDEYKGKWVGDMRNGKGVWVSRRGDSYTGLWDLNYPHGKGCMVYKVRDDETDCFRERSYTGEWNHGKRHGFGEVVYADGSVKKGSWKTDKYDDALVDYDAGQ